VEVSPPPGTNANPRVLAAPSWPRVPFFYVGLGLARCLLVPTMSRGVTRAVFPNPFTSVSASSLAVCVRGLGPTAGSFKGNALGFAQHPAPCATAPLRPGATGAPGTVCTCCGTGGCDGACGDCCVPAAYETPVLCGYLGALAPPEDVLQARLVRAATAPSGYTYAVGTAVSAATGVLEGVLTVLAPGGTSGGGPVPVLTTVALVSPAAEGYLTRLSAPRAIVARGPGLVTIVGTGELVTATSPFTVVLAHQPVIAHVPVGGAVLGAPQCILGNGTTTFTYEDYYDVAVNPCDPCGSLYVCGTGFTSTDPNSNFAVARRIGLNGVAAATSVLSGLASFYNGTGVSLAVTPNLGLVTVGVNGNDGGLPALGRATLWSLAVGSLDPVAPAPAPGGAPVNTQYNDQVTGLLRVPAPLTEAVIVRVVAAASGALYVVARAGLQPTAYAPSRIVAVWAFDGATAPDAGFGDGGVFTWALADGGATAASLPTDALLVGDGGATLLVAGNSFPAGTGLVDYDPTLIHLNADDVGLQPGPFVLSLGLGCPGSGCSTSSTGLSCAAAACPPSCRPTVAVVVSSLPGCADARLGAALAPVGPLAARLVGDVFRRVGCPAQPAGVLDVMLALTCPARVTNAGAGAWVSCTNPCAAPPDGGPARVDYCPPGQSTLVVAGPIVIGGTCGEPAGTTPLPIPGTLYFDAAEGRFYGYDGTAFRALAFVEE
jgi:hypothetical protein